MFPSEPEKPNTPPTEKSSGQGGPTASEVAQRLIRGRDGHNLGNRSSNTMSTSSIGSKEAMSLYELAPEQIAKAKELSKVSGIATRHMLNLGEFSAENESVLIFRVVNRATKSQYYGQTGSGKDSGIKLKSSNYGPANSNVPLNSHLGKQYNPSEESATLEEIEKSAVIINRVFNKITRDESFNPGNIEANNEKLKEDLAKELGGKKLRGRIALKEGEYDIKYLVNQQGEPYKIEDKPIYFYEKMEGEKMVKYYWQESTDNINGIYQRNVDIDNIIESESLKTRILEVLSVQEVSIDEEGKLKIENYPTIPDYDVLTFGRRINTEQTAEARIAEVIEGLHFEKRQGLSEIFLEEIEMLEELSAKMSARTMVQHASEATNRDPQNKTPEDGNGPHLYAIPHGLSSELDALGTEKDCLQTDNYQVGVANNLEGVIELIEKLRKCGYDIKIGARWGFTFDRESEKIEFNQEKRDIWKVLYKDENTYLEELHKNVKILASNLKIFLEEDELQKFQKASSAEQKELFLEFLQQEFYPEDKKFVKNLLNSEYLSGVEININLEQQHSTKEISKEAIMTGINDSLNKLDIIHQYEKILQLQLEPKFKSQDEGKNQEFEKLLAEKIAEKKEELTQSIANHYSKKTSLVKTESLKRFRMI